MENTTKKEKFFTAVKDIVKDFKEDFEFREKILSRCMYLVLFLSGITFMFLGSKALYDLTMPQSNSEWGKLLQGSCLVALGSMLFILVLAKSYLDE